MESDLKQDKKMPKHETNSHTFLGNLKEQTTVLTEREVLPKKMLEISSNIWRLFAFSVQIVGPELPS